MTLVAIFLKWRCEWHKFLFYIELSKTSGISSVLTFEVGSLGPGLKPGWVIVSCTWAREFNLQLGA